MGTTAEKLEKLLDTKEKIKQTIKNRSVEVPDDTTFADYPGKIREIDVSWQPPLDWWDIEALAEADPDPNLLAYLLVSDSDLSTTLSMTLDHYYKASDGLPMSHNIAHVWDTEKDKPCSLGYKTRWIAVYNTQVSNSYSVSLYNIYDKSVLYVYIKCRKQISIELGSNNRENWTTSAIKFNKDTDCNELTAIYSGVLRKIENLNYITSALTLLNNTVLERVTFGERTSADALNNDTFTYCTSLRKVDLPKGATVIGSSCFRECHSLESIEFPDTITTFSGEAISACRALTAIKIPPNAQLTVTGGTGAQNFYYCYALISIEIPPGWIPRSEIVLSNSNKLSYASLGKFINDLGDNTGNAAVRIRLGNVNKAKLTAEQIAVVTNKNYTIA
jgi:hypothetical protein